MSRRGFYIWKGTQDPFHVEMGRSGYKEAMFISGKQGGNLYSRSVARRADRSFDAPHGWTTIIGRCVPKQSLLDLMYDYYATWEQVPEVLKRHFDTPPILQ